MAANPIPGPTTVTSAPGNTALMVIGGHVDTMGYDWALTRAGMLAAAACRGFHVIHTRAEYINGA